MPAKRVARKTKRKGKSGRSFASMIVLIGVLFTLILGASKILLGNDGTSWLAVFTPIILAYVIIGIARLAGKTLSRL